MAEVGRLAGAILVSTEGRWFLVGNPKEPCDWRAAGFSPPGVIDATRLPFVELHAEGEVRLRGARLRVEGEGEELCRRLAHRLVIQRNGSVSERLWRLVVGEDERDETVDARWLAEVPADVWQIVKDTVLRCL